MWRSVIEAHWGRLDERGEEGGCQEMWDETAEVGLQRRILLDQLKTQDCIRWRLGRGNRIDFWLDGWVVGGSLKRQFPRIYAIAQPKNMLIEDAYREKNGSREWIINVNRNLNDWEVEEYEATLQLLSTVNVNKNRDWISGNLNRMGNLLSSLIISI